MNDAAFVAELDRRIAKYDLLCHPFYKAWSEGSLTRADLREYAADYYHHVAAFPEYLGEFAARLPEGELCAAVSANRDDELGVNSPDGRPHHELWLQFASGMGAGAGQVKDREPLPELADLIWHFRRVAREASPVEALASFYAYESQVPRVAAEKARGLRERYGADEHTCRYFTLHTTADAHHSRVWRDQVLAAVDSPAAKAAALDAAGAAARALWTALDSIDAARQERMASVR